MIFTKAYPFLFRFTVGFVMSTMETSDPQTLMLVPTVILSAA